MARISLRDAEISLERLTHAINRANPTLSPPAHIAKSHDDVGGYWIEHSYQQGYCIAQHTESYYTNHLGERTRGVGETHPFGNTCHSASELYYMIQFATQALYVVKP